MGKIVIYAFNGSQMCFMHVLLNALDMDSKEVEVKIIIEGEAVKLVKEMEASDNPLYSKAKEKGLFDGICKACSTNMGVLEYNETVGIPIKGEMSGHPSMAAYINEGYKVVTM